MEREERDKLYDRAIKKWGEMGQLDQMIEECAELIVALNKYKRMKNYIAQKKEGVMENLYEELADVKLCLEQMEFMFGKDKVNATLDKKIQKFLSQLNDKN
jgi:NTP pyrophosphatase (non-canonical NTP hydrolase)